jgi:WD40 repeat protein
MGRDDGKQTALLRGHKRFVQSAVFSPDGMRIVTASHDSTAMGCGLLIGRHAHHHRLARHRRGHDWTDRYIAVVWQR